MNSQNSLQLSLYEAVQSRHSVRRFQNTPLPADMIETLLQKTSEINAEGVRHMA